MGSEKIAQKIQQLAPWFHNIHLPGGELTAPNHPLGDFPSFKWEVIAPHLPADLSGCSVLDIGCNAGFYSIECARRGAHVTALDMDPHYLRQAEWVAGLFGVRNQIRFENLQVYDLSKINEKFNVVLFLGVFYHLRYPLLALDIIARKVKDLIVFQSLCLEDQDEHPQIEDFNFSDRELMNNKGWPVLAFIENRFMNDPTNWWVPNPAAVKAMMRTAGLEFMHTPGQEVYLFKPGKGAPAVSEDWNLSEYLSATGQPWKQAAKPKTGSKNDFPP